MLRPIKVMMPVVKRMGVSLDANPVPSALITDSVISSSSARSSCRRAPVAGGDVGGHLVRCCRAGDDAGDGRFRGEPADRDVQQRHAARLGEALERLEHVEGVVAERREPSSRLPGGAASPRRYLPLSSPLASGK